MYVKPITEVGTAVISMKTNDHILLVVANISGCISQSKLGNFNQWQACRYCIFLCMWVDVDTL